VSGDDPRLTARPAGPRVPARVVVSSTGTLPSDCQLLRTAKDVPVIVYTANAERLKAWAVAGAEIVAACSVEAILADLGRRRFTNVLVEGGAGLLGSFFDAGAFDEVHAFVAPKLVGGSAAPGPLAGAGLARLAEAIALDGMSVQPLGGDAYLHGRRAASAGPG
jgi:diaminohydroxyphosphoribosylaminopyrimidine deaminase/5-amino-6-(5-phosphoribosylamino)uracil reductase